MDLSVALRAFLERIQTNLDSKALAKISSELSASYIKRDKVGGRVVTSYEQAAVYAMARMPATYGAIYSAISHALENIDVNIDSLLDVGAGTGAASWAAAELLSLKSITCVERELAMIQVGKELTDSNYPLNNTKWVVGDMVTGNLPDSADLVIAAYSLNELTPHDREKIVTKLWNATKKVLIIIEPGTPECYKQLMDLRLKLLNIGAKMLAPCTHGGECLLGADDWCHFSCRVARSKAHKMLKGGECSYEDEKYCYMAYSREEYPLVAGRVLRHPIIEKERVKLRLCTASGIVDRLVKKGTDDIYKFARKANAGDSITVGGAPCKEL